LKPGTSAPLIIGFERTKAIELITASDRSIKQYGTFDASAVVAK
jgi:hypothetical protein